MVVGRWTAWRRGQQQAVQNTIQMIYEAACVPLKSRIITETLQLLEAPVADEHGSDKGTK